MRFKHILVLALAILPFVSKAQLCSCTYEDKGKEGSCDDNAKWIEVDHDDFGGHNACHGKVVPTNTG